MSPHFVRAQGCLQRSTDVHVHHICRHTNTWTHNCMHTWTHTETGLCTHIRFIDCFLSYSTILRTWADSPHSDCVTVALHNTVWISTNVVHFSVVWLLHHRAQYYIAKQLLGKLPLSQRWWRRLTGIKNPLINDLKAVSVFLYLLWTQQSKEPLLLMFYSHSLWLKTQVHTA